MQTFGNWDEKEEEMDGKKTAEREKGWSAKKAGQQRSGGTWNATKRKELKAECMEPNERRRSVGLNDERKAKATFLLLLSCLLFSPRECAFFFLLQMWHAFMRTQRRAVPGTQGREGAGTKVCARHTHTYTHAHTCLAQSSLFVEAW